jgi:hypothetical protein
MHLKRLLPSEVRNRLIDLKWQARRLPVSVLYHSALSTGASLDKLVTFVPVPQEPPVIMLERSKIILQGSITYPKRGRLSDSGDWDIVKTHPLPTIFQDIPVTERKWDVHETIRAIFIRGEDYKSTPQYHNMVEAVKKRKKPAPQECYTIEDVNRYFKQMIQAYESMKQYGYLSQKKLGKTPNLEVRIHITRDGIFCLGTGGNHRVRMAELLGIERLPVLIRGVHSIWLKQISQLYSLPPHEAFQGWLVSFSQNK